MHSNYLEFKLFKYIKTNNEMKRPNVKWLKTIETVFINGRLFKIIF